MKIYWKYKQVPELAALSSVEREEIMKVIGGLAMKHWEWWVALFLAVTTSGFGAYFGGTGMSGVIGAGMGGGLGAFLYMQVVIYIGRSITPVKCVDLKAVRRKP